MLLSRKSIPFAYRIIEGLSTGAMFLAAFLRDRPHYTLVYLVLLCHWMASFAFHTIRLPSMYRLDLMMIDIMVNERFVYHYRSTAIGCAVYGLSMLGQIVAPTLVYDNQRYLIPKIVGLSSIVAYDLYCVFGGWHLCYYALAFFVSGSCYELSYHLWDSRPRYASILCSIYHLALGMALFYEDTDGRSYDAYQHDMFLNTMRYLSWFIYLFHYTEWTHRRMKDILMLVSPPVSLLIAGHYLKHPDHQPVLFVYTAFLLANLLLGAIYYPEDYMMHGQLISSGKKHVD